MNAKSLYGTCMHYAMNCKPCLLSYHALIVRLLVAPSRPIALRTNFLYGIIWKVCDASACYRLRKHRTFPCDGPLEWPLGTLALCIYYCTEQYELRCLRDDPGLCGRTSEIC